MQLKNRFSEVDKIRVWGDHPYCAICLSNENCSIHHIDSTISDSILGGVMLCGSCHRIADGHNVSDEKFKERLTRLALKKVLTSGYKLQKNDYEYMEMIADRLIRIRNSL